MRKYIKSTIPFLLFTSFISCHDSATNSVDVLNNEMYSLETCETSFGPGVPEFFTKYFRCVTANMSESGEYVNIYFNSKPPYLSWYYPPDDPNYTPWYSLGENYYQNPGQIIGENLVVSIPINPVPRQETNSWIDNFYVNGEVDGGVEYSMGTTGAALNGVSMFNPCAAPGDVIENEIYSFDPYAGHPAGSRYHYHTSSKGPLEVLELNGLTQNTTPGLADVELYGIMCDGVPVLGCTELDGSTPNNSDWDAQNGHVHDIVDENGTVHFNRYHTHICYDELSEDTNDFNSFEKHEFTPEVSFYTLPGQTNTDVCNVSDTPVEPDAEISLDFNENLTPSKYSLLNFYPNPFNPTISIEYDVSKFSTINLSIIDLKGNVIDILINDDIYPGFHSIDWNALDQPSGIYFIKYQVNDFVEIQKITLLK